MPQERLSNDEFLSRLALLFSSTNSANHGSVFLSQKPLNHPENDMTEGKNTSQILIRATNGEATSKPKPGVKVDKKTNKPKVKLATVVEVSELDAFYTKYADACKKGMEGMRKRDKKKAKEKAKAKKKGKGQPNAT